MVKDEATLEENATNLVDVSLVQIAVERETGLVHEYDEAATMFCRLLG